MFLDGNDNIGWFQSLRVLFELNAKASELWQKYLQKVSFILKQTIVQFTFIEKMCSEHLQVDALAIWRQRGGAGKELKGA